MRHPAPSVSPLHTHVPYTACCLSAHSVVMCPDASWLRALVAHLLPTCVCVCVSVCVCVRVCRAQVMIGLRAKQAELNELMDKLAAMEQDLRNNTRKKEKLEAETELCR